MLEDNSSTTDTVVARPHLLVCGMHPEKALYLEENFKSAPHDYGLSKTTKRSYVH
jgi:hypothetical protein